MNHQFGIKSEHRTKWQCGNVKPFDARVDISRPAALGQSGQVRGSASLPHKNTAAFKPNSKHLVGVKTLTENECAHFSELRPIIYNPETCRHFINSGLEKSIHLKCYQYWFVQLDKLTGFLLAFRFIFMCWEATVWKAQTFHLFPLKYTLAAVWNTLWTVASTGPQVFVQTDANHHPGVVSSTRCPFPSF